MIARNDFDAMNTVTILQQAVRQSISVPQNPILVVDAGVENLNKDVDEIIEAGWLSRVVALRDVVFSNSMIEAFWWTLKHQWLHLNTLDTPEAVTRLVAFYVNAVVYKNSFDTAEDASVACSPITNGKRPDPTIQYLDHYGRDDADMVGEQRSRLR